MAETTVGDNWTVFVFKCPLKICFSTLSELFSLILRDNPNSIPHYTIRIPGEIVVISLRIYGMKIKSQGFIQTYLKEQNIEHSIDPSNPDVLAQSHQWIPKKNK